MKHEAYEDIARRCWWINGVEVPIILCKKFRVPPQFIYSVAWNQWFGEWAGFIQRRFLRRD